MPWGKRSDRLTGFDGKESEAKERKRSIQVSLQCEISNIQRILPLQECLNFWSDGRNIRNYVWSAWRRRRIKRDFALS